jgi:NO-binding membrane sensor protein with MHYT domain/two-component sensor histidine kinase
MTGTYDYWLVLLSVVVAITASYVALDLSSRVAASQGRKSRPYWLAGGAISMGTGIWSMHFIGMLAFRLPIPLSYDIPITLLSLLIAVTASGFALVWVNLGALSMNRLLGGGLLMGMAIISMHYTGMAAMRMDPPIQYRLPLFGLSILIAVAASMVALRSTFRLRIETIATAFWKKVGGALVMGTAIYGMHYAGMAAAEFAPNSVCAVSPQHINNVGLAGTLGGFALLFLTATLLVSAFDAYLADRSAEQAKVLGQVREVLEARVKERTAELARTNQSLRALASRLNAVREEERILIARNVHDELGQALSAAKMDLSLLEREAKSHPEEISAAHVLRELDSAKRTIDKAIGLVNSIATELRPAVLDEAGLAAAIDWQAQDFEKRTRIKSRVVSPGPIPDPDGGRAIALIRILQEALTNITRHAQAKLVEIELKEEAGDYVLQVRDDGIGIPDSQLNDWRSLGLIGMRERALVFGGQVVFERGLHGGTVVTVRIPRSAGPPAA